MPEINFRIAARGVLPVVLLAGVVAGGCGDAGATITRLTVGTPGPDPYVLMSDTDRRQIKPGPRGGGTTPGDAPGLYGGTRRVANCDPAKLVAFLQANPDKAGAWASVHKIRPADIPRFVSGLTPVLLRVDTLVTNHGFRDGKATSEPAVLQAGMGVLVNRFGVPVVKCNCGNPLSQPGAKISTRNAKYTGRSWPGFTKGKVTKIRTRAAVASFVLVDPDATMGFRRPAATTGAADGPPMELPPEHLGSPGAGDPSGTTGPSLPPDGSPAPPDVPTYGPGTGVPSEDGTPGPGTPDPGVPGEEEPGPVPPPEQEVPAPEPNGTVPEPPPVSLGLP
jgi:hypothetical protein